MEFNKTDAMTTSGSISADATSTAEGEIDLYEELKAFAELSPEEQRRLAESLENVTPKETAESLQAEPILPAEFVLTQQPMLEATDAGFVGRAVESVSVYQGSKEPIEAHPRPFEISDPSGPLTEMSPPLLFTGALSRGVCLACGAESGVDDLFCITCGVFIDEVGSTQPQIQPPHPTCAECSLRIVADEIFCPGCGSVLPA